MSDDEIDDRKSEKSIELMLTEWIRK